MKKIVLALTLFIGTFTSFISFQAVAAPLAISAIGGFGLNDDENEILKPDDAFKLSTEVDNG